MSSKRSVHVGCGNKIIPGWTNIDILDENADMNIDILDIENYFERESIDEIYACHVLEHFGRYEYKNVLNSFFNILKPAGIVRISIPDFHELVSYYYETKDLDQVIGTLYGGQNNSFDYHKWAFTFESIKKELSDIGFSSIKRYDWKSTEHSHIRDWSCDYVPRCDENGNELCDEEWHKGKLVSLNIVAKKVF